MNRIVFVVLCFASTATAQVESTKPGASGTVTMSLPEYNRLIDDAARPPKATPTPPIAATLSKAELRLRIDGALASGAFKLEGEVFAKGPSRVPLIAGATLVDATLQNAIPTLTLDGALHSIVIVGPRPFSLDLSWAGSVATETGRSTITIPAVLAPSLLLTLDLPGDVTDVRVEPGLVTKRDVRDGRTVVEASPDRGSPIRVSWPTKSVTPTTSRESRFLSDLKTLVTLDESELRLSALLDLTVVQGQREQFEVALPKGWVLTGASGPTLESFSLPDTRVVMSVRDAVKRTHQILLTCERPLSGVTFPLDLGLMRVTGAQRETGEVAIEAAGTLDLIAEEKDALKRIDAREVHPALRAMVRDAVLAAFRYQARADQAVAIPIDVKRFPETTTLAAIVDRAEATSLVTTEGRALTEIKLTIRNQAQPFLRVSLPAGVSVLSAEVEGQGVKPALGDDGTRIPLLRPGFRPVGPYSVSFVYLEAAGAFAKKGDGRLTLPKLDVPMALLDWEVFLPTDLQVRDFGGNAAKKEVWTEALDVYQLGVPGAVLETVTVAAEASQDRPAPKTVAPAPPVQSANVANLQRRIAGVLPVRIDIPRAGQSYRFARPLVVDEETLLTFKYKSK